MKTLKSRFLSTATDALQITPREFFEAWAAYSKRLIYLVQDTGMVDRAINGLMIVTNALHHRRAINGDWMAISYKEIAELGGRTERTVDRYIKSVREVWSGTGMWIVAYNQERAEMINEAWVTPPTKWYYEPPGLEDFAGIVMEARSPKYSSKGAMDAAAEIVLDRRIDKQIWEEYRHNRRLRIDEEEEASIMENKLADDLKMAKEAKNKNVVDIRVASAKKRTRIMRDSLTEIVEDGSLPYEDLCEFNDYTTELKDNYEMIVEDAQRMKHAKKAKK